MKTLVRFLLVSVALFFATGNTAYALNLTSRTDGAEAPASKHHLKLGSVNDKAVSAAEFVISVPEPVVQPQEEGTNSPIPYSFYNTGDLHSYANSLEEWSYITASALITPGLSSLRQIFPFHLFP